MGKTLVSSMIIDRVAASLGKTLLEVPVGFKWFVPGLLDGSVAFGGRSPRSVVPAQGTDRVDHDRTASCSACSRPRSSPSPARRRRSAMPSSRRVRASAYQRVDAPARPRRRRRCPSCLRMPCRPPSWGRAHHRQAVARAGMVRRSAAQGADRIGVVRRPPSGTEDVYKLYAESLRGEEHLRAVQEEGGPSCPRPSARRNTVAEAASSCGAAPLCRVGRRRLRGGDRHAEIGHGHAGTRTRSTGVDRHLRTTARETHGRRGRRSGERRGRGIRGRKPDQAGAKVFASMTKR